MVKRSRLEASAAAPSAAHEHPRTARAYTRAAWRYLNSDGIVPWLLQLAIAFIVIKFIFFPLLGLIFGSSLPVVAVLSGSMEHRPTNGIVCGAAVPANYSGSFADWWSTCGSWYSGRGIAKDAFSSFAFTNGFNKGDIMIVVGAQRGGISVGDVIVYQSREQYPIIHRVIRIDSVDGVPVYQTKGDFNGDQIVQYVVSDGVAVSSCVSNGRPAPCVTGKRVTRDTPGAVELLDETRVTQDRIIGRAVFRIPYFGWAKIWFTDLVSWVTGR